MNNKTNHLELYKTTALEYLFSPSDTTLQEFEESIWSKDYLYIPGFESKWEFLFSWDKLNDLLNKDAFHGNNVQFSKRGEVIDLAIVESIQKRATKDMHTKVYEYLDKDYTLILNQILYKTPEINDFIQALSCQFGEYIRCNAYCSLKNVHGFPVHADTHDVFAVQYEGKKTWHLYGMGKKRPDEDKPKVVLETKKGDTLYIPRGMWHKAIGNGPSLHSSVTVSSFSHSIYANWVLKEITKGLDLEKYLPLNLRTTPLEGYRKKDLVEILSNIQASLTQKMKTDELIDDFTAEIISNENSNTKFHIPEDLPDQPSNLELETRIYRSRYQRYCINEVDDNTLEIIVWRRKINFHKSAVPIIKFIFSKTDLTSKDIIKAFPSLSWENLRPLIENFIKNRILSLTPYSEHWPIYSYE